MEEELEATVGALKFWIVKEPIGLPAWFLAAVSYK